MPRVLAVLAAVIVLWVFPLDAEKLQADEHLADTKDHVMNQGGVWPKTWPAELEPLRLFNSPAGRKTYTFQRILPDGKAEPLLHYGIVCTTREEFEAAWPHLLQVKSKGGLLILRRGPSAWLGGAAHGVCVHAPLEGAKNPLSAEELKKAPWKATTYFELIVDGQIVDLNRIVLPADTPIIDERFKKGEPGTKHNP